MYFVLACYLYYFWVMAAKIDVHTLKGEKTLLS